MVSESVERAYNNRRVVAHDEVQFKRFNAFGLKYEGRGMRER